MKNYLNRLRYKVIIILMGYCFSKVQDEQMRNIIKTVRPQKCLIIQNPASLVIQLSNGVVQTIPIKTSCNGIELNMRVDPGIYFGNQNEIYLILCVEKLNDEKLLQAAHAYYATSNFKESGLIQPQCAYLIRFQSKIYFIIKSKSLQGGRQKYVDLVDLGMKMREKKICWQDLQFKEIITQIARKYSKLDRRQLGISNIIIGADGSVHFLGHFTQQKQQSNTQKGLKILQTILLKTLYGQSDFQKNKLNQLEANCHFKHPISLQFIHDLRGKLISQKDNIYTPITNPSLKFIRDYITVYYHKINVYSDEVVDTLIALRQADQAKALLEQYCTQTKVDQQQNERAYQFFMRLMKVQCIKNQLSKQAIQTKSKVGQICYFLAQSSKQKGLYNKSYKYYRQCLVFYPDKLQCQFYVRFSQVCKFLNKNIESQSILLTGLQQHPQGRVIYFYVIIHFCDCMKIQEAEKQLMKATPYFRTLELQVATAKFWLTKALTTPNMRALYVRKAKEQVSKVVIQKYMKQSNTIDTKLIVPLYHEILADCYLQQHSFSKARDQYHISKILLKKQKDCGFKLATVTAAQANCLMMQGYLDDAIKLYNEALSLISQQCKNLMDSIMGNRAIAKIRKGAINQGISQIHKILNSTPKQVLQKDYNYIFLENVVKNYSR